MTICRLASYGLVSRLINGLYRRNQVPFGLQRHCPLCFWRRQFAYCVNLGCVGLSVFVVSLIELPVMRIDLVIGHPGGNVRIQVAVQYGGF
ncbi:hypothetical protein [Lysobacter gummosus]|uniref:hypothetical protein n=1 Tax=Lysobacter gummosus TaxID=262324 RepID=UPI0036360678